MLLLAIIAAASPLFAQDYSFVQSDRADVFSRPAFGSPVIVRVNRGDQLTSSGRLGDWTKVRYGSQEGFVPVLLLAPHPPMEALQITAEQRPERKYEFRRRLSAYAEKIPEEGGPAGRREASAEEPVTDYEALKKMESMTVGMDDIIKFMEKP